MWVTLDEFDRLRRLHEGVLRSQLRRDREGRDEINKAVHLMPTTWVKGTYVRWRRSSRTIVTSAPYQNMAIAVSPRICSGRRSTVRA